MVVASMGLVELEETIEDLRNKMFNVAAVKGFGHKDTIDASQELDGYIAYAQKLRQR